MSSVDMGLPEQHTVWPGAVLGAIAHAVFVCRFPALCHEQSWDGNNYNVQNSEGSRGTIAFTGRKFVAALFYEPSGRNPLRSQRHYDLVDFFAGMPRDLESLAYDEALQYLMQDLGENKKPVITSAFWGNGDGRYVAASEPWPVVFDNGAVLVKNQLLEPKVAMANWRAEYELTPAEETLVLSLFERKLADPGREVELNVTEHSLLESRAQGREGIDACRDSLAEMGILF